ncbi:hypothetical protein ACL7TT_14600 [Microbulbifer sp. 2304DJ12-6]|uniref:hypothetical protein n=1 Tax=Microbulbifer sp. 2304DJ12-6 TaxID=3233340 RepID=UPI0039AF72E7
MPLTLNHDGLTPYWYTPKSYAEEDNPPQLQLSPLTQRQLADVMNDSKNTSTNGIVPSPEARAYLFRCGITAWRNILDREGKPIDFSHENLQSLPWGLQIEVANRLVIDALLGEEQEKNLPSQSASPEIPAPLIATTASGDATATPTTPRPSQSG